MPSVRVLSLWELMRHYNVWQLGKVLAYWKEAECFCALNGNMGLAVPSEMVEGSYKPMLKYTRQQCELLELGAALVRCDKFELYLRQPAVSWPEIRNQATVLTEAIEGELTYRRFAFVSTPKAKLLDEFRKDWATVLEKFPATEEDVQHSVECFALEQNTACVFHLMRVAELGLREVAKRVSVKLTDKGKPQPIEFATWDKVIQGINTKIIAARSMPHGPRKNKQLQFHSQAADQCTYIRDIWRNEVSHTRKSYNDGEASGVVTRVREFMELLAKGTQ
jgi:hypothetical protein